MKRFICILLVLALAGFSLSGCDRRSTAPETTEEAEANFDPETTAVGGLTQAVEEQSSTEEAPEPLESDEELLADLEPIEMDDIMDQEVVQDEPADPAAPEESAQPTPTEEADAMPFVTPTPQPNASASRYSEISAPGLGFKFSYPTDWVNIPGRSTVCYVQPLENGTVYPARVSVTMKRLPHKTDFEETRSELIEFLKVIRSQYDESTFKLDPNIDIATKFMGKSSIGVSYLAYDGSQEIKGYAVITYFERYLYVFHFL